MAVAALRTVALPPAGPATARTTYRPAEAESVEAAGAVAIPRRWFARHASRLAQPADRAAFEPSARRECRPIPASSEADDPFVTELHGLDCRGTRVGTEPFRRPAH